MRIFRISVMALLLAAGSSFAAELDNYYLEQFGETSATSPKTVLKTSQKSALRKCGMPLHKGLKSDWNKLASSTQKILAKYLALPDTTGMSSYTSPPGNFIIWYKTSGADLPAPVAPYTLAGWKATVANTFEEV